MPKMQNIQVKVYEAPALSTFAGKADANGRPMAPPKPKPLPAFNVAARNVDEARKAARKKLNGMGRLQSLSCTRDGHIQAILMHPEDARRDKPAK